MLPLIIDAAAEDDFKQYKNKNIDLIIFSGLKALEGPSSGIILGKQEYINWCKNVDKGMGRAMKVSKEATLVLLEAIKEEKKIKSDIDLNDFKERVSKYIKAKINKDPAGREIFRLAIQTNSDEAKELIKFSESNDPAIFTRNYLSNIGIIEFDTRALSKEDIDIIVSRLSEYYSD